MASSAQSRAATWRAEPGATSLGHPRACKLVTEFISTPERDTRLQLPLLGQGRHISPAQGAREAFTGGCREHHPQPGQADPPQHPHSQALPPPSSHPTLHRQPGSLLPEKSHALPGNMPLFFFSLCYTAVLTKIQTCRVMPLVSGSSEENAAMPVSSQQGERLLEKGQETHSLQEQHPQRPPTSSPLPTTTDPPAFTCRRTAGQLLQL